MKAIILAAGASSRFWPLNQKHKSLIKIMGRPLIWHTIQGLKKSNIKDIVIIQGLKRDVEKELSFFSKELNSLNIKYIVQQRPKGMGNALYQARNLLKEKFLVLNAERVDIQEIIVQVKKQNKFNNKSLLIGQKTDTPWLFGMAKIQQKRVLEIVEKPAENKEPSKIKIIGCYFLEPRFFEIYQKIKKEKYDFEKALSVYLKENKTEIIVLKNEKQEAVFLKYPWDLFSLTKYLFQKNLGRNEIRLGKNVKIMEKAIIKPPWYIGDNCLIGNHSLIRDYSNLENNVMVGALAEVTRSIFQENVHVHSGYFGDSIFGENCRVGAGTVTANVKINRTEIKPTNINSLGVIVGPKTKIGINVSLMPGRLIGMNCVIGPQSVVAQDIKDNTIFYTEFKRIVKKQKNI